MKNNASAGDISLNRGQRCDGSVPEPGNEVSPVRGLLWLGAAFCLAMAPVLVVSPGIVVGETANSRLATVYALVHDGTWYIDRPTEASPNPFEVLTVDKVQAANGRILPASLPYYRS